MGSDGFGWSELRVVAARAAVLALNPHHNELALKHVDFFVILGLTRAGRRSAGTSCAVVEFGRLSGVRKPVRER